MTMEFLATVDGLDRLINVFAAPVTLVGAASSSRPHGLR
jgi:hypothetical protein